jgi:hypothetical protein
MSSLLSLRAGGFTFGDFLLVASLACVAVAARAPAIRGGGYWSIAFLIVVGGAMSTWQSSHPGASLLIIPRLLYLVTVLPWQMRALLVSHERYLRAALWWVAGAALCGFGTILQSRFGSNVIPGADVTSAGRYSGFAQHVSDTGAISAVAFAFCIGGLGSRDMRRRSRLVLLVGLAFTGVGLLLSGSVSGLLSIAVAAVVVILRGGVSLRRLALIAIIGFAALALSGRVQSGTSNALSPWQRIQQVTSADSSYNTSASRLDTDRLGWQGIKRHPVIGVGLDAASGTVLDDLQVHNLFLGAWYQGGVLLFVALGAATIRSGRAAFRTSRRSALGNQVVAAWVATVTFSLTGPSDYNRYYWVPMALAVTLARLTPEESGSAVVRERSHPTTREPQVNRSR